MKYQQNTLVKMYLWVHENETIFLVTLYNKVN